MVKNPPANAEDIRDRADSPEEGMATHSIILAWAVPWTETPGGSLGSLQRRLAGLYSPWGRKESDVA